MTDRRQLIQDTLDEARAESRAAIGERRRPRTVANRAFGALKAQHASERTAVEAAADRLNDIASSGPFLVLHVIWFGGWILLNTGVFGNRAWDPFPFGLLTLVVSLEAIFLSIFVLMAQKRESAIAELREELALQVNMRMEEEVTKTLQLVAGLYTRLGHVMGEDEELGDMLQPLDVSRIEQELLEQIRVATTVQGQRWRLSITFPWRRATDAGNLPDPHDSAP
ncbi:MAG TPA: DUF1003 domain-containing protein [Gemmatimonadaceae bacterium]|nr:DUF1003 domain-containing protein [Gemmatimonadaceae bacterium]